MANIRFSPGEFTGNNGSPTTISVEIKSNYTGDLKIDIRMESQYSKFSNGTQECTIENKTLSEFDEWESFDIVLNIESTSDSDDAYLYAKVTDSNNSTSSETSAKTLSIS